MSVKELKMEAPRERAKKYGVKSLSNTELLAIILRSGSKKQTVLELAGSLLKEYQSIQNIRNARLNKLVTFDGMGEVKSITLLASLELGNRMKEESSPLKITIKESQDVYLNFKDKLGCEEQEHFLALYLNSKNEIIDQKELFLGTVNYSVIHPREIFKEGVLASASKVIVLHNHPSGDPTPSLEDEKVTKDLIQCGYIMGIPLIDHVIVAKNTYYSFLETKKGLFYEKNTSASLS